MEKRKLKQKKMKNKFDKLFLLNWKKIAVVALLWVVSVLLHNFVSGIFSTEEPVFFIIAVFLIPLYLIISVIYSIIKIQVGKKK